MSRKEQDRILPAPDGDDQLMIRYLLHELPEDERMAVQDRFFGDASFAGRLRAVESELIDAYVRGELTPERRTRIEELLLQSPPQRQKLAFARAFHSSLSGLDPERPRPPFFSFLARPVFAGVAFGLIVILAVSTVLLTLRTRRQPEPATPLIAQQATPGRTPAFLLTPGVRRGAETTNRVALHGNTDLVRLDLELERGDENQTYAATIATQNGRVIWREEPLASEPRGSGFITAVWVPDRVLRPGTYELTLSTTSPGGNRELNYYNFTVAAN